MSCMPMCICVFLFLFFCCVWLFGCFGHKLLINALLIRYKEKSHLFDDACKLVVDDVTYLSSIPAASAVVVVVKRRQ